MALLYKDLTKSRQQQLKLLDRRVRLTSEVLASIRQIKLYAYEGYFGPRITEYRGKELARLRKRKRSNARLSMVMVSKTFTHKEMSLKGSKLADVDTHCRRGALLRHILSLRT